MLTFNRSRTSGFLSAVSIAVVLLLVSSGSLLAATSKHQAPRDPAVYQAWLTKEVRHQLVMLPWLTIFDNLEYKVDGSKVTLMGYVVRPVLKEDAGRAVKTIEGVTGIDNQIEVLPASPMDDGIRHAEVRAIYGFPSLQRYAEGALPQIHIVVKNGHVLLFGIADTQSDKDLIGLRANTVPDVFSVTNNLLVANAGGK